MVVTLICFDLVNISVILQGFSEYICHGHCWLVFVVTFELVCIYGNESVNEWCEVYIFTSDCKKLDNVCIIEEVLPNFFT